MMYVSESLVISLLICILHWLYRWRNPKCNGKLPPGSMGLPLIGESFQYFTPYTTQNVPPFISKRVERFGSVFRTSLVGYPVVVSTDPELNRYVVQQEGKLVRSWYMDSFDDIVGRDNVLSVHGSLHKYLRNLILNLYGTESLKRLLPEIEELTSKNLELWSNQASVDLKEATSMMIYNFNVKKLFSYGESESSKKLKQSYAAFIDGLISFPLNIPGTAYWKCLQGRKEALKMIKNMVDERRAKPNTQHKDFLDVVIQELKKDGSFLTEETASDLLFALPFAAFESASSAMALGIQYLSKNPSALGELTREHEAIIRNRKSLEPGITWKEYRSMTFTHMVINETVRLANIVPGIFRKVVKNIELKGYTIPPGWIIMVCPTATHLSPEKYDDPLKFNPSRWQGQELHSGSKNFMAFGGGVRLCVGAEFVKLQMAIFLHHFVTKYRWNVIKGGDVVRKPGLKFPNGFHIQILEKKWPPSFSKMKSN